MKSPKTTDVEKWVKTQVSARRFAHIKGVVSEARKLARANGLPEEKAVLAAWFHDCAKEWTKERMLETLRGTPFKMDGMEKKIPALWHPHAGAAAAARGWKVRDPEVLEAIRCHTLGNPRMGALAQVLFVADFIEPGRDYAELAEIRKTAYSSLREGVLSKSSRTIGAILGRKGKVHPRLLETWNAFLGSEAK